MTWASAGGSGPIVCGHRGAPSVEPENTLASFAAASDRGATWVEFDVRPTRDDELVIHHDPVTSTGLRVASVNRSELDAAIPRFADLVAAAPHLGLDIELKTDEVDISPGAFADLVVDQIASCCAGRDNLMVTSFDAEVLLQVRERAPEIATGLLFWERDAAEAIELAVAGGHQALAPWIRLLDDQVVDQARQAGLDIVTWTVNEPEQVALAATLGVDMIIGDDPAVIIEHL